MKKRLDHINIMDTEYNIEYRTEEEDPSLEACLGYCDKYQKLIVIDDSEKDSVSEIDKEYDTKQWKKSYDALQKKVLRHELTHAFITECGFAESSLDQWANNEELVDFLAINAVKLVKLYERAGAL